MAAYLASVLALGCISEFGPSPFNLMASPLLLVAYFGGLYLLFEAMLRRTGATGPRRYFQFAGLAFVVFVGVLFGLNVFLVPGLVLAARWMLAPSLLVGNGSGIIEALGNSWYLTRGNTKTLTLAVMILVAVPLTSWIMLDDADFSDGAKIMIGWSMFHVANVLLAGFSVAVFRLLRAEVSAPHQLGYDPA